MRGGSGGTKRLSKNERVRPANDDSPTVEITGEIGRLANPFLAPEGPENQSPDALAGASGRKYRPILRETIRRTEYRIRHLRATALAYAIGQAHPDDARQLLTAALIDLSAGQPIHAIFARVREDARWWSRLATPSELMAFLEASLEALADKAMHLTMRKRLLATLFRSMSAEDRATFLVWGQRHV